MCDGGRYWLLSKMLLVCSSHLPHAGYTPRPSHLPPFVEGHVLRRSSSCCEIIHCKYCLQLSAFKIFIIPIFTKNTFLEKFYIYPRYKIMLQTFQDLEMKRGTDWQFFYVRGCLHHSIIYKENPTDATVYQNFISYLYEAQHVSGDTPPIIRSLKLY